MKKYFALLITCLALMCGSTVFAAMKADLEDPDYIKKKSRGIMTENVTSDSARSLANTTSYTGKSYTHESHLKDRTIVNGLDVSKWDGNIDWKRVKRAGIDFAIIRIGYSRLSSGAHTLDPYYRKNIANAKAAGVKVGVYYFAQSINTKEAVAEAEYVLRQLKGEKLDLPVVFDSEDTAGGRLARAHLSKSAYTQVAEAFCDRIKAAGYMPMVYSSYYGWKDSYDHSTLKNEYGIWLARYNTATHFSGTYCMWQYTETGRVDGINGYCDVNFYYRPKNATTFYVDEGSKDNQSPAQASPIKNVEAKNISSSAIEVTFDSSKKISSFEIYRSDCYNGNYKKIGTTKKNSFKDKDLKKGKEYYYYVKPALKKGNVSNSEIARAYIPFSGTEKVKVTQLCNVRKRAGISFDSIGYLPVGTTATLKAITKNDEGIDWYRIEVKANGRTYKGYISSRCSKRI